MAFRFRYVAASALAAALAFPMSTVAQERVFFGIATGGTGGTYYPLGGMLAQLISNKVTISGKKLSATAETAGASVANAQLLGRKDIESAFVAADILDAAYKGTGQFDGKPLKNLRALGALYPEQVQLVTLASANIKGFKDLKGKSVSSGSPGSGQWQLLGDLLEAYGMTRKDIGEDLSSFAQSVDKIKDGNLIGLAHHRGRAYVVDRRPGQRAGNPHRPARRAGNRGDAQEAAVLRQRADARQHVQGTDGAGRDAGRDGDLGDARRRHRRDGLRGHEGALRKHGDAGPGPSEGQGNLAQDGASLRFDTAAPGRGEVLPRKRSHQVTGGTGCVRRSAMGPSPFVDA